MSQTRRTLDERDLERAVGQGVITPEQAQALLVLARQQTNERAGLTFQHLAYYLGGLVVIGAMGWYVTKAWVTMTGIGFMATAAVYAAAFLFCGDLLFRREGYRVPGGVLVTLAVCMTPMFVYGFEMTTGLWPSDVSPNFFRDFFTRAKAHWLFLELSTVAGGMLALRRYAFPFITAPMAVALWFLAQDLAPLLFGDVELTRPQRAWTSVCVGAGMLLASFQADRRFASDFSFWGYLFGLMAFWGGITSMESASELTKFGYCLMNLLLMAAAILLERRVFLVFGALGVSGYLGHLAYRVFRDSMLFPFTLSAIGVAVILCGVLYQRRQADIEATALRLVPEGVLRALPRNRARGA